MIILSYKHCCVIDSAKHYKTFVLVTQEPDESGEMQNIVNNYTLFPDEELIDTYPPVFRPYAGADGFIKPFWDGSAWAEEATTEEIAAWELEHPAPEIPEPTPDLADRVNTLETEKADKAEVQAVWDSMAVAYNEGVQTA